MTSVTDLTGDLEEAIDKIAQSYDGPAAINSLESAALPNRRAVIEAYQHIAPIIYMGFYSTRPLNKTNLRHSLSEHAYPAYENLREQIHRAITYELKCEWSSKEAATFAHETTMKLFHSLPALREMLNEDAVTAYELDPAARSVEEVVFSYPTLEAITAYRVANVLRLAGVPLIPRIIAEYAHGRTGIDIHPAASIGRRLFIDHGTGVVVGETTIIGNDVKIYQGVTLGALSTNRSAAEVEGKRGQRHPTIEDNVTIYAGATILGGDTVIGKGSIIGGNVWIVKSIPAGSKIFGRAREESQEDGT